MNGTRSFLGACAAFFVFSASCFSAAPNVGPLPPLEFHPPEPERIVLKNGLIVYLLEDHELPLVSLTLRMKTSPADEPGNRPGLFGFMGEVWRSGGTSSRTPEVLNEELEGMAADVETGADTESAVVSLSCLSKDLSHSMAVMKDILLHPAFRSDQLALSKAKALEGLRGKNDTPGSIAKRAFRDVIYGPTHLYARELTPATVNPISRGDLGSLYKKVVSPEGAFINVSGDYDRADMVKALEDLFSDWTPQKRVVPDVDLSAIQPSTGSLFYVEKDFNQSRIVMGRVGLSRHDPDHFALELADYILGGGGTSRLFGQIRSRLGLAYMVGSFSIEPKGPGLAGAGCQTKAGSTVAAVRAILAEMGRFVQTEPTADEMSLAKDATINSYVFRFNSPVQIVGERALLEFYGYPSDYMKTYPANVAAVTPSELLRVSKRVFSPEGLKIVVVGNQKKFDEPLKNIGSVTPIPLDKID